MSDTQLDVDMPDTSQVDLILSSLKYIGITVGAVSGVLGTVIKKTHEEKTIKSPIIGGPSRTERKITTWGRISLTLTILGGLMAFGAQVAEDHKKRQADIEARNRAEEQIRQANEMLERLEQQGRQSATILGNVESQGVLAKRSIEALSFQSDQTRTILTNVAQQGVIAKQSLDTLSTQATATKTILSQLERQGELAQTQLQQIERGYRSFNLIELDAVLEFPRTNQLVADVMAALDKCVTNHLRGEKVKTPSGFGNAKLRFENYQGVFLTILDAFLFLKRVSFGTNDDNILSIDVPDLPDSDLKPLLTMLRNGRFTVAVNKQHWRHERLAVEMYTENGDLRLFPDGKARNVLLRYLPTSRRLFVEWQGLAYRRSRWLSNGKIFALGDLDNAQCAFSRWPEFSHTRGWSVVLSNMRPIWLGLKFDNQMFTFDTFQVSTGPTFSQTYATAFSPTNATDARLIMSPFWPFSQTPYGTFREQ